MRGRERLEKVMEYMKRYEYTITALTILLDAVVGTNPKQIMMTGNDKEARDDMTPEERSAIIIGLIIGLIACAIVCYLRITNQIVCAPNTI
jgi:hypothetical protein